MDAALGRFLPHYRVKPPPQRPSLRSDAAAITDRSEGKRIAASAEPGDGPGAEAGSSHSVELHTANVAAAVAIASGSIAGTRTSTASHAVTRAEDDVKDSGVKKKPSQEKAKKKPLDVKADSSPDSSKATSKYITVRN